MPELPEVETVVDALKKVAVGHTITRARVTRHDLRFDIPKPFAQTVTGRVVKAVQRRAKYILVQLSGGQSIVWHLGMSGRVRFLQTDVLEPARHEHVGLTLDSGLTIVFTDPRRFGLMLLADTGKLAQHKLLAHLGVEPFAPALNGQMLYDVFQTKKAPVKTVLLDQTVVAGLGNIYVCEALFYAGISPRRKVCNIGRKRCDKLAETIEMVITDAIRMGGTTLRDHIQPGGEPGYFAQKLVAYGRENLPCPVCLANGKTTTIKHIVLGGRATYYCPVCQK